MREHLSIFFFQIKGFGEAAGCENAVSLLVEAIHGLHRAGRIEHEVDDELGLLLELLHVVAIGLGVGAPVDVPDLVAGRVLLVLGELDRRAVQLGAVQAGQRALDDQPRLDRQRAEWGAIARYLEALQT